MKWLLMSSLVLSFSVLVIGISSSEIKAIKHPVGGAYETVFIPVVKKKKNK